MLTNSIKVHFKKLRENAIMPRYMTDGAAGCDFYAALEHPVKLWPGKQAEIPFGIAIEIPDGYMLEIRSRSSYAIKYGLEVYHGVIDSDFRGELSAIIRNNGENAHIFYPGDRVAQGVFIECTRVEFIESDELSDTRRGDGGFGSTGNHIK